ncbi:hypothetical protein OF83DRAFT_1086119 [Amylostereum chailletii]|nr:hypothetical protein OF83DRAFT_1086119 [Amylostereum chailletii]
MPADRTPRGPKKEDADGIQLTWTTPVETHAAGTQQIAFAPAVTPGTFVDSVAVGAAAAHAVASDASPSLFFPSATDAPSSRRPGHGKKKAENHIPRPPNAFILFRSSFIKSQHVSTEVETNHSTLSKIIGLTWQNMPPQERQFWHGKAKAAQAEHKARWPDYAFRPLHMKGKAQPEKRKVREVGPKDLKRCERIAQLLVEGKKGADLEEAIQEFDRTHVRPIVARFEAPITAKMYRRSSSQPAPDSEGSSSTFLRASPKPSSRRLRAVSSQPSVKPETTPSPTDASSPAPWSSSPPPSSPAEEDNWRDMPPLVAQPAPPADESFPSNTYHSFEFNPFSFNNHSPASYIDAPLDPLSTAPPPDMMSSSAMPSPAMSSTTSYAPLALSVDTSMSSYWSPPSASFPDSPCSPQSYGEPLFYSPPHTQALPTSYAPAPYGSLPPYTPDAYQPHPHSHPHQQMAFDAGAYAPPPHAFGETMFDPGQYYPPLAGAGKGGSFVYFDGGKGLGDDGQCPPGASMDGYPPDMLVPQPLGYTPY